MDDKKIREWGALNLSLILKEDKDKLLSYINQREIDIFKKKFFFVEDNLKERWIRVVAQRVLDKLPFKSRWKFASVLKKTRNLFLPRPLKPSMCSGTRMILDIARKAGASARTWGNKPCAVCLFHDVDTSEGYDFIPSIVKIEKNYNIRTTFNFLTEGEYNITKDVFSFLKKDGFEVGMHGVTHDIAFAYRTKEKMEEAILKAVKDAGFSRFGFRSPALSMSAELIQTLERCNARYDSSISLYYKDRGCCFPYRFPETGLWELPLCLQDDVLFRDLNLTWEDAFTMTREFIEDVINIGGVCTLNFHPVLVKSNLQFYERLMSFLAGESRLLLATANQLIDIAEKN